MKIWNADGTKETVLFDNAVYTKNRNFRLYLSSKLGKSTRLRLAEYCTFYGSKIPTDRQVFFDSICIPANAFEFPLLQVKPSKEDGLHLFPNVQFPSAVSSNKLGEGSGPSPYVQLDEFMLMVWKRWNPSVYIRQWKVTSNCNGGRAQSITYYPANCRYCFNIGREHKSNGTFWTVDFDRNDFNQRCFDFDCRGTSSNYFPLPSFIVHSLHPKKEDGSNLKEGLDSSFTDEEDATSLFEGSASNLNKWFTEWESILEQ